MPEDLEIADRIYSAEAVMREGTRSPGLIGVGHLVRLLSGRGHALTAEQTRFLFSHTKLMQMYRELKGRVTVSAVPMVAAASDGQLTGRPFNGGKLTLVLQDDGVTYVIVQLDESTRWDAVDLLLESAGEGIRRLEFHQAPDDEGIMQEFIDRSSSAGQSIIRMLQDPLSSGDFIRAAQ